MRFFGQWTSAKDITDSFEVDEKELSEAVIIAAHYDYQNYEGYAFLVFRKDGKLYEVHGSHCSCNGLEGQWSPEETTYDALIDRLEKTDKWEIEHHGEEFFFVLRNGLIDEMFEEEVLLS